MAIEPQINTGSRNLKARAIVIDSKVKLNPGAFVKVQLAARAITIMLF
jgi:multidrug efflux pump subunit AcrA (membrane-fusion protein)